MEIVKLIPRIETPVSREEIPETVRFSALLTDHPIIRDEAGVLRYKRNPLVCWLQEHIDLNEMWKAYGQGTWSREAFMQFYRDIGYSLSGFEEVWGEELDALENSPGRL